MILATLTIIAATGGAVAWIHGQVSKKVGGVYTAVNELRKESESKYVGAKEFEMLRDDVRECRDDLKECNRKLDKLIGLNGK